MHAQNPSLADLNDAPVDAWALLTGGSFGIVAGLFADLLRLAMHRLRRPAAPRTGHRHVTAGDWQRSSPCSACSR